MGGIRNGFGDNFADGIARKAEALGLHLPRLDRQAEDVARGGVDLKRDARPAGASCGGFGRPLAEEAALEKIVGDHPHAVGGQACPLVQFPAAEGPCFPDRADEPAVARRGKAGLSRIAGAREGASGLAAPAAGIGMGFGALLHFLSCTIIIVP